MNNLKVCIIGLGYVGLPLAALIAEKTNYKVFGFDIDEKRIEKLKKGESPIDHQFKKSTLKKITFSDHESILEDSDFQIICVPTPVHHDNLPDFRPLISATTTINKYLKKGQSIIIESTINPGVCEELLLPLLTKLKVGEDFELAHCPERINPGDKLWHLENIPRNIGATTKKGCKKIANFYRKFLSASINEMSSIKAAEASKIIENTFRDINIAYVNELAKVFDLMEIDLLEVINAAKNKPFAFMAHYPGCGVGGHCIPVDPYYLIENGRKIGFDHKFLKTAREINNSMPEYTVNLMETILKKEKITKSQARIAILGLSYKGNISDYRESPALEILKLLKKKKFAVESFDPLVPHLSTLKSLEEALQYANCIIVASEHDQFKKIPTKLFKKNDIKIIIDGKNCLNKNEIIKEKILYKGIGH